MSHEQQQQQNLELVLNNIASPEARTYLRTAVAELLGMGFTHCSTDGWVSPIQRQPLRQALTFDAARLLLHAAALELSRSGKFAMGQVVNDAVHVVAPLPPQAQEAREEAEAAVRTLEHMGYTYHGSVYWKPPLGPAPDFTQSPAEPHPFGWWLVDAAGVGRFSRSALPDALAQYQTTPGYSATPLHARQPVAQEPAFYLSASDWGHIRIPMTKHRDVRALRHGFDHGDTALVPFYPGPPAQAVDMTRALQLAEEVGAPGLGTYVFDREELEHFLSLLLAVKP